MNIIFDQTGLKTPSAEILGLPVAVLTWEEGIALLDDLVEKGHFTPVSFLNAHNANVAAVNAEFADVMRRFLVLPDGVGVDIASKLLYGEPFPANLNGTDFIPAFLKARREPLTVGLLGTTSDNVAAACEALRIKAPQHRYEVIGDGFFDAAAEEAILGRLRALHPDILLVAMGVPRQELWIGRKLGAEHCTVPVGVGALLDFLSGAVPRAPAWIRRLRLEWAYRLWLEPSRLWRRYLVGNPLFLWRVARQRLAKSGHGR
ncbi:MAG: glycosyltransferase [Phyllobacteriaceae bacterium]|nr:glycosyltransferase [Phyllobacteriaceae bacterium]MBA92421.1 glycosyltransferase [Phyllobacteriaceae bacterium]